MKPETLSQVEEKSSECIYPCLDSSLDPNVGPSINEIYRVSWLPEDHLRELVALLQGVTADKVESQLISYVEENIEPTGWSAIWRATPQSSLSILGIQAPVDLVVDVLNVSRFQMEVDVVVRDICATRNNFHDETLQSFYEERVTVPLLQLYPLVEQSNPLIDVAETSEVIELIRFFYNHIWLPWDSEEYCEYDEYLVRNRLKLLRDIKVGTIPLNTSSKMLAVKRKASAVRKEITQVEDRSGVEDEEEDLDERDVVVLMELHKRMDRLKSQYETLQDPILRQFANHCKQIEHQNIIDDDNELGESSIRLVVHSSSVTETAELMSQLPSLIEKLPGVTSNTKVRTFPSLQVALNTAKSKDTIILFPGRYILNNLGLLSKGGTICGVGEGVVIQGSADVGDVMLDLTLDDAPLELLSLTLQPLPGQVALTQHSGTMHLSQVTVEGGDSALVTVGKSVCIIENSNISDCCYSGVEVRGNSFVTLLNSDIKSCLNGLKIDGLTKVSVKSTCIRNCEGTAVRVEWTDLVKVEQMSTVPEDEQILSAFHRFENNNLEGNKAKVEHTLHSNRNSIDYKRRSSLFFSEDLLDDVFLECEGNLETSNMFKNQIL